MFTTEHFKWMVICAGPVISTLKSMSLKKGLKWLADSIRKYKAMENYYAKTRIHRVVYLQAAHMMFRRTLKKNGQ